MWCGRGAAPKPICIQREGAQLQIRGTWSAGPGDDQARFLADLRALRDSAAIGFDELAARAHYPSNVLKEAENGPSLPGLPILSAYVRACEGDVLDWEERWRRLNPDVADDLDLPVRPAGASAAAVAGARAGVGVAAPDVYDPERIRAALRGNHARSDQASRRAGDPGVLAEAAATTGLGSPDPGLAADSTASAGWDPAPGSGVTAANGNHTASPGAREPFDGFTDEGGAGRPRPVRRHGRRQLQLVRAARVHARGPRRHPADPAAPGRRAGGAGTDGLLGSAAASGPARPAAARRRAAGRGARDA